MGTRLCPLAGSRIVGKPEVTARHLLVPLQIIIHLQMESGSSPDVPGRTYCKDAFIAAGEQHPFQ
jgi:hypothetical protein